MLPSQLEHSVLIWTEAMLPLLYGVRFLFRGQSTGSTLQWHQLDLFHGDGTVACHCISFASLFDFFIVLFLDWFKYLGLFAELPNYIFFMTMYSLYR